jgi:type II secretory pathway pseudopilin PulG
MRRSPDALGGFTMFEVLTVCVLIAILIGIGFPYYASVMETARKTQAKNEEQQIVTAVNAYYTDYGKYPIDTAVKGTGDAAYSTDNNALFDVLRNVTGTTPGNTLNPRAIVYITPPISKTGTKGGVNSTTGIWYDPFGSAYNVAIDGNYNNIVVAPSYTDLATTYTTASNGDVGVQAGVIVWSFGKNGALGGGPAAPGFSAEPGTANNFFNSGDAISWQ